MNRIQQKASDAVALLNGAGYRGVGFDPATIIAIITTLIQMWKNCGKSVGDVCDCCDDPGPFDLFTLNRVVAQRTGGNVRTVRAVSAAVQQVGRYCTHEDVSTMFSEVP